jgi:hypothetical protein
MEGGLVKGEHMSVDGSFIQANAAYSLLLRAGMLHGAPTSLRA